MSQAVLDKAKELAGVIAQSPEYVTMRATEDAAAQDEALQKLCMMSLVNAQLSSVLNPGGSQGGCSGNCSACSGCN